MQYFPLAKPRKSQEIVINQIHDAFQGGSKVVVLEAPVGSGKSAIAMTLARYEAAQGGNTHLLTPRKSLQDQYYEDFGSHLKLMKGRASYPCLYDTADTQEKFPSLFRDITLGKPLQVPIRSDSCATAPCIGHKSVADYCTRERQCPYTAAIEAASLAPSVVHNLHSFLFQTKFAGKFGQRSLLIVDEAHELEGFIREFCVVEFKIHVPHLRTVLTRNGAIPEPDPDRIGDLAYWEEYLMNPLFVPEETALDRVEKERSDYYQSERDKYVARVLSLTESTLFAKGFSVDSEVIPDRSRDTLKMNFKFTPHSLGNCPDNYLLSMGKKVLLMSGTIYNKDQYCRALGLDPEQVQFFRIGTSFPVQNRPILAKPKFLVPTSHAQWDNSLPEIVEKIRSIMGIFHDARGLIHAPSYKASAQLAEALKSPRVITHSPDNFQDNLEAFYDSDPDAVFMSPVCQQGVDFKGDRARFQIIIRVPYPSTSSAFMEYQAKNNFQWYSYQALITFGQQIGRINRAEDDYGATFLLDDRFPKFIGSSGRHLPAWVKEAIQWK